MKVIEGLLPKLAMIILCDNNLKLERQTGSLVIYGNEHNKVQFNINHYELEKIRVIKEKKEWIYSISENMVSECNYLFIDEGNNKTNSSFDFSNKKYYRTIEDKSGKIIERIAGSFKAESAKYNNGYKFSVIANGITINTFDSQIGEEINTYSLKNYDSRPLLEAIGDTVELMESIDKKADSLNDIRNFNKMTGNSYIIDYYFNARYQESKREPFLEAVKKPNKHFYVNFNNNTFQVYEHENNHYTVFIINKTPVVAIEYDAHFNMVEMYCLVDRKNSETKFKKKKVDINDITINYENLNAKAETSLDIIHAKINGDKRYESNILNTLAAVGIYRIMGEDIFNNKDIINIYNSLNERLKNIQQGSTITEDIKKGL